MATKKKPAHSATPPAALEVIATLERMAKKPIRDGMARYGIPNDKALGISVGALRQLGKRLGKSHALHRALGRQGCAARSHTRRGSEEAQGPRGQP